MKSNQRIFILVIVAFAIVACEMTGLAQTEQKQDRPHISPGVGEVFKGLSWKLVIPQDLLVIGKQKIDKASAAAAAEEIEIADEVLAKMSKLPKHLQWTAPFYAIEDISKEQAKIRADLNNAPRFATKDAIINASTTGMLVRIHPSRSIALGKALKEYRTWYSYRKEQVVIGKGKRKRKVTKLVPIPHVELVVDRSFLIPEAATFFVFFANLQYEFTKRPLHFSSFVRDRQKQKQLIAARYPAAAPDGPQESTHLRGVTGDLRLSPMTRYQQEVVLRLLAHFVQISDIKSRVVNVYLEKKAIHIEGPITALQLERSLKVLRVSAFLLRVREREQMRHVPIAAPVSGLQLTKCKQ